MKYLLKFAKYKLKKSEKYTKYLSYLWKSTNILRKLSQST